MTRLKKVGRAFLKFRGEADRRARVLTDVLERRQLLSGYAFSTIANFLPPPSANPYAALVLGPDHNLYGTTNDGGTSNDGTLFEIDSSTHALTTLVNFNSSTGANPYAALLLGVDQNLYGTTVNGGIGGYGTVFEINISTHAFSTLANFNTTSGTHPYGALITGPDQNLYGTASAGGSGNSGTVFEMNITTHVVIPVVNFNYGGGQTPRAGLILGTDHNFYGTTFGGGTSFDGTVFEVDSTTFALATLVNFNSSNGMSPEAALTMGADSNFYGTTSSGGTTSYAGTVFEVDRSSHAFTTLINFNGSNGSGPNGLVLGSDQNLYGTTTNGGNAGTVFEINHVTQTLATLFTFNYTVGTGSAPFAALVVGADNNLYGTTYFGGSAGLGTLFEIDGETHGYSTLFNFTQGTGYHPQAGLTLGSDQNLYGTTSSDVLNLGSGTIFEVDSGTHVLSTTATFDAAPGGNPVAGLVLGPDQNFYGTTPQGGLGNYGTVFEYNGSTHVIATIIRFNTSSGTNPTAGLVVGSDQNLYGTTYSGGTSGYGTVFEVNTTTHAYSTIVNFNSSTGQNPSAGLILGPDLNLYGTTYYGARSYGTVFEVNSTTHAYTTLVNFNSSTGTYPDAALTVGSDQNLYGTTYSGGVSNYGTVFEVNSSTHVLTTVANLNLSTGTTPYAGLVLGPDMNLYGTACNGGSNYDGTIFQINGSSHALTILVNFNSSSGSNPRAGLILGSDHDLYGTTYAGGTSNFGTIFELALPSQLSVTSGTTTLAAGPGPGLTINAYSSITVSTGAKLVADPAESHATRMLITSGLLTLANNGNTWSSSFDLGNNDLDIASALLSTSTDQLKQGFANGTWAGSGGITSVSASSDPTHLTALGVIQNNQSGAALFTAAHPFDGTTPGASDILVKYTYYGDANLDGKVDASDYSLIDSGFNTHATGWFNGDFNYDGVINGSDYTLIDNAFNTQGATLAVEVAPKSSASKLVAAAAMPRSLFSQTATILSDSWFSESNSMAAQIFSQDSSDWVKRPQSPHRELVS